MRTPTTAICATATLTLVCAAPSKSGTPASPDNTTAAGTVLASTAFEEGELIPVKYSGYGDNVSPELSWNEAPNGTRSFALICRDPDAPSGTFYHWIVFNTPDTLRRLPEGLGHGASLPFGGSQGNNSFGKVGYDGPRTPSGTHRYYFDLYALDRVLVLDQTATAGQLLEEVKGHVLARGSLMGKYAKP